MRAGAQVIPREARTSADLTVDVGGPDERASTQRAVLRIRARAREVDGCTLREDRSVRRTGDRRGRRLVGVDSDADLVGTGRIVRVGRGQRDRVRADAQRAHGVR